ncbi:MAG TPA: citramalate synthase [Bacillota bacterium]
MAPTITVYDTTLRDGAQRAGLSFSLADKLRIARRLDALGLPYIEGGWPGSNPKDARFFAELRRRPLRQAKAVAFSSTRKAAAGVEEDPTLQSLLEADTPTVAIFGKSWDHHVTVALGTSLEENLRMIAESVAHLRRQGREVVYDAEHFFDGLRANPDYAWATLEAAAEAEADWLVLCDTNGGTLPWTVAEAVREAARRFPGQRLGIHAHDDGGVGVANTLAAVEAGALMVQGTVNGYGERCGNANLCTVIADLELKMGRLCLPPGRLAEITAVSHYVSEVANLPSTDSLPYVGRNAFTHKAGVHVSALAKDPVLYEHTPPESVGNQRHILVSELAGRSNLLNRFADSLEPAEAASLLELVKAREFEGYQYEGAEASLELLSRGGPAPFQLLGLRVLVSDGGEAGARSEVSIKLKVGERVVHTAAEGNGPVNALDSALRKALMEVYPEVARVRLTDYKVRVLEGSDGTAARVRVLIESSDGERAWGTVGVSVNILEASWQALADSLVFYLTVKGARPAAVSP